MATPINSRVQKIQQYLVEHYLDAFLIPHEDEYLSEYVAKHNERLCWATGFTGSAGAAIITPTKNAIFVDGRYVVQVRQQAPSDLFEYRHLINEPPLSWIKTLPKGSRVGYDAKLHSLNWIRKAKQTLGNQYNLVALDTNPIDTLWTDRPTPNLSPISINPLKYSGKSSQEKRQEIALMMQEKNEDALILTALDSICWLLNIRANDIPCLPVALCVAILKQDGNLDLLIDSARCSKDVIHHLGANVKIYPPAELENVLKALKKQKVSIDPATTNTWIVNILKEGQAQLIEENDPCSLPKACKNKTEIQGMIKSHERDAVAMVKFLAWLDDAVLNNEDLDEAIISDKAETFRRENDLFTDLSFATISATGTNAAMCHYNHINQEKPSKLQRDNVYLIDSGAQYEDGTTDITRTIAIGTPCAEIIHNNTLVLKGHIALAQAIFPQGTTGQQLDILARQFLWAEGLDFDHGTGHGVGCHLSVHEGPQRISPKGSDTSMQAGMITSNEPGFYKEDGYGIRIENLTLTVEKPSKYDRKMLGFETLTLVPFDKRLIDKSMLTNNEITWINHFHALIWQTLEPKVSGQVKTWLRQATAKL